MLRYATCQRRSSADLHLVQIVFRPIRHPTAVGEVLPEYVSSTSVGLLSSLSAERADADRFRRTAILQSRSSVRVYLFGSLSFEEKLVSDHQNKCSLEGDSPVQVSMSILSSAKATRSNASDLNNVRHIALESVVFARSSFVDSIRRSSACFYCCFFRFW